jgi:transposase-like protein
MPGKLPRSFSPEFKEAAVLRILAGERVHAVADDLQLKPQVLYRWWSNYDRYGVTALRPPGRPRPGHEVIGPPKDPPAVRPRSKRGRPRTLQDGEATKRIAELERKVGEQALEIDFFERALRHVRAPRPPSDGPGGSTSSRSSTR